MSTHIHTKRHIYMFLPEFILSAKQRLSRVLTYMKIQSAYQNIFEFRLSRWIYNQNVFIKYSF